MHWIKKEGACCECEDSFGDGDDSEEEYVEQRVFLPDERYIVALGEYFPMKYAGLEEYCSKEREILIYDEERPVTESPPPPKAAAVVYPSLADAAGYRPPPKVYQAHEWELCSLSDYEEQDFRQTTPEASSDEGEE